MADGCRVRVKKYTHANTAIPLFAGADVAGESWHTATRGGSESQSLCPVVMHISGGLTRFPFLLRPAFTARRGCFRSRPSSCYGPLTSLSVCFFEPPLLRCLPPPFREAPPPPPREGWFPSLERAPRQGAEESSSDDTVSSRKRATISSTNLVLTPKVCFDKARERRVGGSVKSAKRPKKAKVHTTATHTLQQPRFETRGVRASNRPF